MRILTCTGNYAKTPYELEAVKTPVYSIEELCWVLKECAFFLDNSVVSNNLVEWIRYELGIKNLADTLSTLVKARADVGSFIMEIMKYTQFFDSDTIKEIDIILRKNAGMSMVEKKKAMFDAHQSNGKIVLAIDGYKGLITELTSSKRGYDPELLASIYNNLGVARTRLFLYEEAAVAFNEALKADYRTGYMVSYLSALRMVRTEDEYLDIVMGIEDREAVIEANERYEKVKKLMPLDKLYVQNKERAALREEVDIDKYYQKNKEMLTGMTEEYRKLISGE